MAVYGLGHLREDPVIRHPLVKVVLDHRAVRKVRLQSNIVGTSAISMTNWKTSEFRMRGDFKGASIAAIMHDVRLNDVNCISAKVIANIKFMIISYGDRDEGPLAEFSQLLRLILEDWFLEELYV